MIEAKHNKFIRKLFNLYINNKLKSNFSHFYSTNRLPSFDVQKPILVLQNHFSWWDGFFSDLVYRKYFYNYKIYMMILESTLNKYKFFKYLGAYSINKFKPRDTLATLHYTKQLLTQKNTFLVIFPTGELLPYSLTKIKFKTGIEKFIISKEYDFFILPLSFKIQYENASKPNVYFRFGEVLRAQNTNINEVFENFYDNLNLLELEALSYKFTDIIF